MNSSLFFKDESELTDKIKKFSLDGPKNLFVISDFDSTLTKAYVNGKRVLSSISLLRDNGYLSKEYCDSAYALADKYLPIEKDGSLSFDYKCKMLIEWGSSHRDLLVKFGMKKSHVDKVVNNYFKVMFRDGVADFMDALDDFNVPLFILSAGYVDFIKGFLEKNVLMSKNVYIVANEFSFDEKGSMVGYKGDIIHSMNKRGHLIKGSPLIKDRSNILLLGDSLSDPNMSDGLDNDSVIKVGFLNDDEKSSEYLKKYDVVITDGSFDYVCSLFNDIKSKHI